MAMAVFLQFPVSFIEFDRHVLVGVFNKRREIGQNMLLDKFGVHVHVHCQHAVEFFFRGRYIGHGQE